jgi:hypothetical protein
MDMADCGAGQWVNDLRFGAMVVVLQQPQSCVCDAIVVEISPCAG